MKNPFEVNIFRAKGEEEKEKNTVADKIIREKNTAEVFEKKEGEYSLQGAVEKYKNSSDEERKKFHDAGFQCTPDGYAISIDSDSEAAKIFEAIIASKGNAEFSLDEKLSQRGFYVFGPINIPQVPDSYHDEDDFRQAA